MTQLHFLRADSFQAKRDHLNSDTPRKNQFQETPDSTILEHLFEREPNLLTTTVKISIPCQSLFYYTGQ